MNRGKPLTRRTPLVARTPLDSRRLLCGSLRVHAGHRWTGQTSGLEFRCPGVKPRKPMPRVGMAVRRPAPAVPPSVRRALKERSGGLCEARLADCRGQATDPAHRDGTGSGGRRGAAKVAHDRLSNLTDLCRSCHQWTHNNIAKAEALGLMLRTGDVPEETPVLLLLHSAAARVLLDNAGGWRSTLDGAA